MESGNNTALLTHDERVLHLLEDGQPHTHLELYRLGVIAHSRAASLRKKGYTIAVWRDHDTYFYQLLASPKPTPESRFWAKVVRSTVTGCWNWAGHVSPDGYGRIQRGRRTPGGYRSPELAHRVSYELSVGPIPDGLELDHLCRNRRCVNPEHLEPVTHRENQLRGNSITGINARRTHCANGHEFNEANSYIRKDGSRRCRVCQRHRNRKQAGLPLREPSVVPGHRGSAALPVPADGSLSGPGSASTGGASTMDPPSVRVDEGARAAQLSLEVAA